MSNYSETEAISENSSDCSEDEFLQSSPISQRRSQVNKSDSSSSSLKDSSEKLTKSVSSEKRANKNSKPLKKQLKKNTTESDASEDFETVTDDVPDSEEVSVAKNVPSKKPRSKTALKLATKSGGKKNLEQLIPILKKFFENTKRPYIISEVVTMFKDEATKPVITNAMNELAESGYLLKKEYGKNSVFLIGKTASNLTDSEISDLNLQIRVLEQENLLFNEKISGLTSELQTLTQYPTNMELKTVLELKKMEIEENKKRMILFSEGKIKVEKSDMEKVDKELLKYKKILKDRKQVFKDIQDVLMENSGMSKDELNEAAGIDG